MAQIVDQWGRPIEREVFTEPQTAKLVSLHHEYANHPSRGLTPGRLASILEAAEQGDIGPQHELFRDMEEKDGHIFAEMSKRKRALLNLEWSVEPPRGATAAEQRAAEQVEEMMLELPDFEDVIFDAADGIGHGFACLELEWQRLGRDWLPARVHHRDQTWFQLRWEHRNEIRLRDGTTEGAQLQPFGWITHIHRAQSGYLARTGLHRVLAWPFLFKNYSIRDLAELLEIYGIPVRLGTYPSGSTEDEKRTLMRALLEIGHRAAGIIPQGMEIDFKDAAKGEETPFSVMIQWCERTQSKAIVGATLTAEPGAVGSLALGEIHNEVRWELTVSDARQLAGTFTRDLVWPLAALNTPLRDPRRSPRFRLETRESADLKTFSEALPPLVNIGLRIPEGWARDKLQIPAPAADEAVLTPPGGALAPLRTRLTAATAVARTARTASVPRSPSDEIARQLEEETAAPMDRVLDRIRELVEASTDYDELLDRLLAEYGTLDIEALGEVMAQALTVADLRGRDDVGEGR